MSNEATPGQGNQNEGQEGEKVTRRKVLQGLGILGGVAATGLAAPKIDKLLNPDLERQQRNEEMERLTKFRLETRDRVYRIGEKRNRVGNGEPVIDNLFKKTRGDSAKVTDQMIVDEFEIADKQ